MCSLTVTLSMKENTNGVLFNNAACLSTTAGYGGRGTSSSSDRRGKEEKK